MLVHLVRCRPGTVVPVMRLLDAFCGRGGAGRGYQAAGFEVVGVDTDRAAGREYPGEFVHGDAVAFIREHGHEFDAIHASPPCQRYSIGNAAHDTSAYPDLIAPTRDALKASGRPWVIENVVGARRELNASLMLCGSMFGLAAVDTDGEPLRLERHRLFETSHLLFAPGPCDHDPTVDVGGVYGGAGRDRWSAKNIRKGGYVPQDADVQRQLMGLPGMTKTGLALAIPPAYTAWLGTQLALAAAAESLVAP